MSKRLVFTMMLVSSLVAGIDTVTGQGFTETLVMTGDSTPDETTTFKDLDSPKLNDLGQVGFKAALDASTFQEGVFLAESGVPLVQIARTGDPTDNGVFNFFGFSDLNNTGQVAFHASLKGTSGGFTDNRGFYVGSGGPVTEAARMGQPLALSQPLIGIQDLRFSNLKVLPKREGPTLNDSGRISFIGSVAGCQSIIGGCTPVEFDAVFTSNAGVQKIMAKEGSAAPLAGGGTQGTFDRFTGELISNSPISTALINNSGQVVYRADIADPNGAGIYFAKNTFFFYGPTCNSHKRSNIVSRPVGCDDCQ